MDSIKEKATETAAAAAELAKNAAKSAKLNLQIAAEQDKIKKAQIELGKLCHQDYASGSEGDIGAYLPCCEDRPDAGGAAEPAGRQQ